MKKTAIFSSLLLTVAAFNLNAVSLSGTAVSSASNVSEGNSTFVIVDTTGGDTLNDSAFTVGLTLTSGTSFGDYYVAGYNGVVSGFGGGFTVAGNSNFTLGTDGDTAGNDKFYVVAFGTQSGDGITLTGTDTFGLVSASNWVLPVSNGDTVLFGGGISQVLSVNGGTFAVVPEPSAYAMLAGLLALGAVMIRRRS